MRKLIFLPCILFSQLKKRTAGASWFDLHAPDPADLPRLYREVEALRLRNQLDPKRFYRKEEGEGKGIKGLPKYFAVSCLECFLSLSGRLRGLSFSFLLRQMGTILPTKTPFGTASSSNLSRTERKRTLVDELIDDAEASRVTKKKFKELQTTRAAKGRGTLAKRKAMRQAKW